VVEKGNNEKTHTLNKHTWEHKALWRSTSLAKTFGYFEKKVKNSKVMNFLHKFKLEKTSYNVILGETSQKLNFSQIYIFYTLLKNLNY
jgi:hypothetical protein